MTLSYRHKASWLAAAFSALLASAAAAQQPAALILEAPGGADPSLPAYAEVTAGTYVTLPEDGRLVFVHYRSCRAVTVQGGGVRIDQARYDVVGGRIVADRQQACPQQIRLAANVGTAGALIIRGGSTGGAITLSSRPSLVIVGEHAGEFARARIVKGGKPVVELPIENRRLVWPPGQAALDPGEGYSLVLDTRKDAAAVEKSFAVDDGAKDALVLLRVD